MLDTLRNQSTKGGFNSIYLQEDPRWEEEQDIPKEVYIIVIFMFYIFIFFYI